MRSWCNLRARNVAATIDKNKNKTRKKERKDTTTHLYWMYRVGMVISFTWCFVIPTLVLWRWSVINPGVSSGGTSNSTILAQRYRTGPGHELAGLAVHPTISLCPSRRWGRREPGKHKKIHKSKHEHKIEEDTIKPKRQEVKIRNIDLLSLLKLLGWRKPNLITLLISRINSHFRVPRKKIDFFSDSLTTKTMLATKLGDFFDILT